MGIMAAPEFSFFILVKIFLGEGIAGIRDYTLNPKFQAEQFADDEGEDQDQEYLDYCHDCYNHDQEYRRIGNVIYLGF